MADVGTSWDSVDGKKTVVKIEDGRAFVSIEGSRHQLIIPVTELDSEIKFDERQFASRQKMQKKAREAEEKDQAKKALYEDTHGFADQFSAMRRAKILKTLNRSIRYKGAFLSVKNLIEKLAAEGYEVHDHPKFKRIAQLGDEYGPFLDQRTLTKTGLDYLEYLRDKNIKVKSSLDRTIALTVTEAVLTVARPSA